MGRVIESVTTLPVVSCGTCCARVGSGKGTGVLITEIQVLVYAARLVGTGHAEQPQGVWGDIWLLSQRCMTIRAGGFDVEINSAV